jgi:hypothetical protein
MWRILLSVLLALPLLAANVRLYLKDGNYHLVREYKVLSDRVRYYSVERGDWEEIPTELVDLKRTEGETRDREQSLKDEAAAQDAEEKAERAARREVERVPMNPGVYWVDGEKLVDVKRAESKVVTNKRRSILKAISPLPMITGKATVELDGLQAPLIVSQARPEFYIRLSAEQRFGIVKLTPTKISRIVEKLTIVPVSKEVIEEQTTVEIFRRQVGDGLYRIWPTKPLEAGEYAVVEYTDGKVNLQVWDFSVRPGS